MTLVAVVGSANLDVILSVPRRPEAGETLEGTTLVEVPGGKGANQARASAAIAPTMFIGCVGTDAAGLRVVDALAGASVDLTHLARSPIATGRAFITLTPDAQNSIVVMALANAELTAEDVIAALEATRPEVVLTQLEVPPAVTEATVQWCGRSGARLVLNPSPVRELPAGALELADPLIVNEGEARALLGRSDELIAGLAALCRSVVLTAGERGAFVAEAESMAHLPGSQVVVADTTGAGDTFAGTLAGHLALGADLLDAASRANDEAARVIQLERSAR